MTTITDAFGTFHDISIEAFNSFSIQIPHMMGNTDLRNMDFSKAFKQLGGKSFSTDLLQKIQDISPEAKALLETAAQQIESRALSVAAQTFTELEKSVPVAGFLLGVATNWALEHFLDISPEEFGYRRGEWLFIDLGERRVFKQTALHRREEILQDQIFGGGDFFEESLFEQEHDFAIGFYVSNTSSPGTHTVFNFNSGKEEDFYFDKLRACPQNLKEQFDENDQLSQIRELRIFKDYSVANTNGINTDPGVEVIYKGEAYNVVSQHGESVLIQNQGEQTILVPIVDLQNGRRANDSSYNYSTSTPGIGQFAPSFSLVAFEWVWVRPDEEDRQVDPNCEAILAMIMWLGEGSSVQIAKAYDGSLKEVRVGDIAEISNTLQDSLRYSQAVRFKKAVTENYAIEENAMGYDFPLMCFNHNDGIFSTEGQPEEGGEGADFGEMVGGKAETPGVEGGRLREDYSNVTTFGGEMEAFDNSMADDPHAQSGTPMLMFMAVAAAVGLIYVTK